MHPDPSSSANSRSHSGRSAAQDICPALRCASFKNPGLSSETWDRSKVSALHLSKKKRKFSKGGCEGLSTKRPEVTCPASRPSAWHGMHTYHKSKLDERDCEEIVADIREVRCMRWSEMWPLEHPVMFRRTLCINCTLAWLLYCSIVGLASVSPSNLSERFLKVIGVNGRTCCL